MSHPAPDTPFAAPVVQEPLRLIARILRDVHPLSLEVQSLLAALLVELADALDRPTVSPERLTRLTETTIHLVEAVHQQRDQAHVSGLRTGMERAVAEVESHYPNLAGLGRRLLDALSNLGI